MTYNPLQSFKKVRVAGSEVLILPLQGIKYFAISMALFLGGLVAIETQFLPRLETENRIISPDWVRENRIIDQNNYSKNLARGQVNQKPADGNWLWRSTGFPVTEQATKSRRILVIGDSYVWGDGYANMNDLWWRQLQRELTRRGYNQVEVIAAGLNGASTRNQLEQARQLVPVYKPDLLIWGYVANDPDEWVNGKRVVKRIVENMPPDRALWLLNELASRDILPRLSYQLKKAREGKIIERMSGEEHGYYLSEWTMKLLEGENFELYKNTIKELGRFQAESGIPGFMIALPNNPDEQHFSVRYDKIRPLMQSANLEFYDILNDYVAWSATLIDGEKFVELGRDHRWGINPADGHPGTSSTYFYAVKAADFLEAHYPEVLHHQGEINQRSNIHINDWVPYNLNPMETAQGVFTFKYPESQEYMLRMPVGRPFVQLNLELPAEIREIRLAGSGLKQATLDITAVNSELGFDDHTIYSLETKKGASLVWNLAGHEGANSVNTIRLSASFETNNRQLTLTLVPSIGANQL